MYSKGSPEWAAETPWWEVSYAGFRYLHDKYDIFSIDITEEYYIHISLHKRAPRGAALVVTASSLLR